MAQPAAPQDKSSPGSGVVARTLLDVLIEQGVLDQPQYEEVRLEANSSGRDFEGIVLEKGYADAEKIAQAKGVLWNVGYVRPSQLSASPEALTMIHESVARRYQMLPFAVDGENKQLSVAMANPMDLAGLEFVEKKTGMKVVPFIASRADLKVAISERYSQNLSSEVVEALKDVSGTEREVVDVSQLGQVIREAPIAKIVQTILTFAVNARASDIHIEPTEVKTRIRFRIDGILYEKLVLPRAVHESVISRIKILSDMKIDERRLPQDGRFSFKVSRDEIDLRISSMPTVFGEKIVMRLLKKSAKVQTLTELGLRGKAYRNIEEAIVKPNGVVLVTGPTGSGKTTTLYAILSKISTTKVNVMTLEDPVEYEIAGVNQVQVNPQAGLTFASGLRSMLRQDPNIMMVGEIRDSETAELAVHASLTGHLVFSTLHTRSSAGALPRLVDMGVEPFLLASAMSMVVGQRVVRTLCPKCKQEFGPSAQLLGDITQVLGNLFDSFCQQKQIRPDQLTLYKPGSCPECGETGYLERVGIFEVLVLSEKISRLAVERAPAGVVERQAVEEGMILMKQDGYLKVLEGVTTVEEVLRVAEI